MAPSENRPGVAVESFPPPADPVFRTGVAGFVCPAYGPGLGSLPVARLFTSWPDFAATYRDRQDWLASTWHPDDVAWHSVQGFFANGGSRCWVALYDPGVTGDPRLALSTGVSTLIEIDDVDLVCAPSLAAQPGSLALQLVQQLVRDAEFRDDWFLILDAPSPGQDVAAWVAALRAAPSNRPQNAAVYHPWLVPGGDVEPAPRAATAMVPASGHVAGIFARTDTRIGVHTAPANEAIDGIVDVTADVGDIAGANPIRAYPGRGIRVWGARTLAVATSPTDPSAYIGVRRLVLTLDRWLVRALDWTVFETNDVRTWVRIHRELNQRLTALFEQGAFQGSTQDQAFYVKCDDENNPPDVRTKGELHVDVGIAAAVPKEFIKIRLVRSAEGITVA